MRMETLTEIVKRATSAEAWHVMLEILMSLDKIDMYVSDLLLTRRAPGEASLFTAVVAVAQGSPQSARYLEIGVRKGFSMALFVHECVTAQVTGIDLWEDEYAGVDNPGAQFVRKQLVTARHRATASLLQGDSHEVLPALGDALYDVITVDGDHTVDGALRDLNWAITHITPGGIILFDDIANPAHLYLNDMFRERLGERADFDTWQWDRTPNGIALAQRHYDDGY